MPTAHQLQLTADSLQLALLERQRSLALSLPSTKQDAQITQSLTQLRQGLEDLEREQQSDPFRDDDDAPDADFVRLRRGYEEAYAKFHGSAPPTLSSASRAQHAVAQRYTDDPVTDPPLSQHSNAATQAPRNKNVRFRDSPDDDAAARAALFSSSQEEEPYRDNPPDHSALNNVQIHAHHTRALQDQDAQLDILGQSLGRQ